MKNPKQLEADELLCPHCQSSNVQPIQVGYFWNTLLLSCNCCGMTSLFKGPEIEIEKEK